MQTHRFHVEFFRTSLLHFTSDDDPAVPVITEVLCGDNRDREIRRRERRADRDKEILKEGRDR